MTTEKLKATDTVSSGLTCNLKAGEAAQATGVYHIECHDKDGNLKWQADSKNLVVNAGLAYMAGTAAGQKRPAHSRCAVDVKHSRGS